MQVNVVCRNKDADRVIPRFARYLSNGLGWELTSRPIPDADVYYLSGYFEWPVMKRDMADRPVAAYFTHVEEQPPGNAKAKLYDSVAARVDLRIATAALYAEPLAEYGPTVQVSPPVERGRFTIPAQRNKRLVAGFSGFTYANGRKGEDIARRIVASEPGQRAEWRASGRGWPVPTRMYAWAELPAFYQSLDVLVVTATVEGVPMPPLECLACGVSVVVPRGVGLLDELPDLPGIHRYERGDARDAARALGEALDARGEVDREALRGVTAPYSVTAWCEQHRQAFEELIVGLDEPMMEAEASGVVPPQAGRTEGGRGIYCVAFGAPARACAQRLMETVREHLPEIPIAFCGAEPLGLEDVFIAQPDSDAGGRRAKLKAYELSPWDVTLYLDVDTEVISGDARFFFELIEDGWEFVIAKDPHLMDTMSHFRRANNLAELAELEQELVTLETLQINGGVWSFGRNERVAAFFERWQAEWERHAQRDQGALVRAMYADPLKTYVLGNEWNWFERYSKGVEPAAIKHYPGRARRWKGLLPGRIDGEAAWSKVKQFEARSGGRARGRR